MDQAKPLFRQWGLEAIQYVTDRRVGCDWLTWEWKGESEAVIRQWVDYKGKFSRLVLGFSWVFGESASVNVSRSI